MLLLLTTSVWASADGSINIGSGQTIHLKKSALFLNTATNPQSLQQVVDEYLDQDALWNPLHISSISEVFRYGYSWQKISLHNPTDRELRLFLICTESSTEDVQAAIIRQGTIREQWHTGTSQPYVERPFSHRMFIMPFDLQPGETVTVLAAIRSGGNGDFLRIQEQKSFWAWDNNSLISDSLQLGAISILSLLVLFLFVVTRETTTLYFYLYILNSSIHNLARDGFLDQYLYPNIGGITHPLTEASAYITTFLGVIFLARFLEFEKRRSTIMLLFSRLLATLSIVQIASIFVTETQYHTPWVLVSVIATFVYFLSCWIHSLLHLTRGHHHSRVFAIVGLFIVIPMFMNVFYFYFRENSEPAFWLQLRSGDVMFTVALYVAMLYDLKREQLKKQEALLKAEARTQFFATLNHELRTPLNGVIGMAELLNQTDQTPIQKQYSETIINSGNHLLTLINDILDLTRISEGKLEFENSHYDLDQTLSDCLASFLPMIFRKRVPIYFTIQPDMPIHLIGDQYRIRQVIYNLLSNAMKFTEKGHILLRTTAERTDQEDVYRIIVQVTDTGIGIPAEAVERIFSQFTQADVSTTRRYGGSGLGLAICKAIAESLGGEIQVDSAPGRGSCFTVSFMSAIDTAAERQRRESLSPLRGRKIILVSDRPVLFSYFVDHLRYWGVDFVVPQSIDEAIELIENNTFDCMVAYFISNAFDNLRRFNHLTINTLLWHHKIVRTTDIDWPGRLETLPVPASYNKMELAMVALIEDRSITTREEPASVSLSEIHNLKILVVEDNQTNRMVTLGILRHLGLEADSAENGKQAVDMCRETDYSVILMDCEMPILDGYEATRQILKNATSPKPIIVAVTAQSLNEARELCFESGMYSVVLKPITIDKLRDCLTEIHELIRSDS